MTDMLANVWVIDLKSAGVTLPDWWRLETGQCRAGSLKLHTDFSRGPFSCADPWADGLLHLQGFSYEVGHAGANTARILGTRYLVQYYPVQVDPGTECYSFTMRIDRARSAGPGACANCSDPVCVVLNEITVIGHSSEFKISNPRDSNHATWQGGAVGPPGCPLATPTRKNSWGQMKSLYR